MLKKKPIELYTHKFVVTLIALYIEKNADQSLAGIISYLKRNKTSRIDILLTLICCKASFDEVNVTFI